MYGCRCIVYSIRRIRTILKPLVPQQDRGHLDVLISAVEHVVRGRGAEHLAPRRRSAGAHRQPRPDGPRTYPARRPRRHRRRAGRSPGRRPRAGGPPRGPDSRTPSPARVRARRNRQRGSPPTSAKLSGCACPAGATVLSTHSCTPSRVTAPPGVVNTGSSATRPTRRADGGGRRRRAARGTGGCAGRRPCPWRTRRTCRRRATRASRRPRGRRTHLRPEPNRDHPPIMPPPHGPCALLPSIKDLSSWFDHRLTAICP